MSIKQKPARPKVEYTTYDDDGRVLAFGAARNPEEQCPEAGGVHVGGHYSGDEYYFVDGEPVERPEPTGFALSATEVVADGESEITLTGVPAGARVVFGGQSAIAKGGPIVLDTDHIGRNEVIVDAFPARTWVGVFDGTAP